MTQIDRRSFLKGGVATVTSASILRDKSFAGSPAQEKQAKRNLFGGLQATDIISFDLEIDSRILKPGQIFSAIADLQKMLNNYFGTDDKPTRVMDHDTHTKIETFQRENNLTVNGFLLNRDLYLKLAKQEGIDERTRHRYGNAAAIYNPDIADEFNFLSPNYRTRVSTDIQRRRWFNELEADDRNRLLSILEHGNDASFLALSNLTSRKMFFTKHMSQTIRIFYESNAAGRLDLSDLYKKRKVGRPLEQTTCVAYSTDSKGRQLIENLYEIATIELRPHYERHWKMLLGETIRLAKDPHYLTNGSFNVCGTSAALYYVASHNPAEVTRQVNEILTQGEARLDRGASLKDPELTIDIDREKIRKLNIEYILGAAINRKATIGISNYNPEKDRTTTLGIDHNPLLFKGGIINYLNNCFPGARFQSVKIDPKGDVFQRLEYGAVIAIKTDQTLMKLPIADHYVSFIGIGRNTGRVFIRDQARVLSQMQHPEIQVINPYEGIVTIEREYFDTYFYNYAIAMRARDNTAFLTK